MKTGETQKTGAELRWHDRPGVRSGHQLTFGERSADRLRNGMGSWTFVFAALLFLAVWMGYNRNTGFDKYPFILLNLVLSCLAALQGAATRPAATHPARPRPEPGPGCALPQPAGRHPFGYRPAGR
jgi:Protein of unknown function (DUF1003)